MIKQIKYFRPQGNLPIGNGIAFWKGDCLNEMRRNEQAFISSFQKTENNSQEKRSDFKGGIIVFSNNNYSNFSNESFIHVIHVISNMPIEKIITGNFFKGKYTDIESQKVFDKNSTTIEFSGISTELLLLFGVKICREFNQQPVLIKDFNTDKIYFVTDDFDDDLLILIKKRLRKIKYRKIISLFLSKLD